MLARGWPWDTWVVVSWTASLEPRVGDSYENDGSHWIRIRWGKATHFRAYLDTQRLAAACREMAEHGVDEAAARPVGD